MSTIKALAASSTAALALALSGCTTANIPGSTAPITQSEAQMGAEAHPQLLAEFGGAMTGPQAQYVQQVGQNIAVQSGLGNARESFTVSMLNSSVNNAFAIPGGFVYTTRQLVTLMDNEAELAAVLGHEVGHVAARHSQRRQANQQRNTLLGAGAAILSGILLGNSGIGQQIGQAALQGSQLLTLSFSRGQELEADTLGIRYLTQAGYDPTAMATVLASLAAQNSLDARIQGRDDARLPAWASTHPDPASRVQQALATAQGTSGITNRDTFLERIDGLMYGDDPEQGIIEGRQFIQPVMRLSFTAPQGYYLLNGTRAVSINGQSGQAQFTLAPYSGNLENYVASVFAELDGNQQQLRPQSIQRTTVNGLPAAYGTARVNSGQGEVEVVVFAYEFANDRAYHFQVITQPGGTSAFTPMFNSLRRISAAEAANVVPRHIETATVRAGDTIRTLANRMAYDNGQLERFLVLNSLDANEMLQAGQKVKLVVRGR
jgi:predicted Zn-dependent protease